MDDDQKSTTNAVVGEQYNGGYFVTDLFQILLAV